MKNRDKIIIGSVILGVVFACIYAFSFDSKLDLNGDNAQYLSLAKNLSKGYGYATVTPNGLVPASHFPPGYSFIISVFMFVGINSLVFFKLLNGLFLLASLLLLAYVVWKLTDNYLLGFAVAFLPVFSPHLQHFSNIVMSEMSYLFFTVLTLFSLYKYQQREDCKFWKSAWFYTAVLSATATYYIRTVGASCLFALIVYFLFRKEWKQAFSAMLGIVVFILPWSLRNSFYGIESRYFGTIMTVNPWRPEQGSISSFSEMVEKMIKNFDETVIKGFKEGLFPFLKINYGEVSSGFEIVAGCIILAFIFLGAWRMSKFRWYLIAYLIANVGLFMLWHGGNGIRYVVPILPMVYLCFYTGVFALFEVVGKRLNVSKSVQRIPAIFLLMAAFMFPAVKMQAAVAKMPYPKAYQNYFRIAKAFDSDRMRATVVCCRKPGLFEYYAPNVYTTNYQYTKDTYQLIGDLVDKKVDYVVLDQLGYSSTGLYLYPAIVDHAELFAVETQFKNPDTFLLKFDREKATAKIKDYEWKYVE